MTVTKTEEFLEKLSAAGLLYESERDYSKTEFKGWHTKIIVIDKKYGTEHSVVPTSLYYLRPGNENSVKLSLKNALNKTLYCICEFKSVHGDEFDYSEFVYNGYHSSSIVICRVHGKFFVNVSKHLDGSKCPKCVGGVRLDEATVLFQFSQIHGDTYLYPKFKYVSNNKKAIITCRIHGDFYQTPLNHKSGNGCPECSSNRTPSTIETVEKFKLIHGNTYGYDNFRYVSAHTKSIVTCHIHGNFSITPSKHKSGRGCPACNVGFTKPYVLSLLNDLSESDLLHMSQYELFTIIQQGKLPKGFKKLMDTLEDTQERVTSLRELKQQYETNDESIVETIDGILTPINDVDDEITKLEIPPSSRLPQVNPISAIHALDRSIYAGMDETAMQALVQFRLRELWNAVLRKETTIQAVRKETGEAYFTAIKNMFLDEYKKVEALKPAKGYRFPHEPNLMQKLTVHRLLTNKCYGNWSGTGAGKTLSFILSSRKLDARFTLVIALNDAVSQVERDIMSAYPDSVCHTEYKLGQVLDRNKHNYLILNYEKFQQKDSEKLFQSLTKNNQLDFVVLDEVHNVKQRGEQQESIRRAVMTRLLERARENNPELHVLAMSATPVINGLHEAKSLLTLMSGLSYDDIDTNYSLENAFRIFGELTLNGLRFIPKYDISINELTGQNMSNLNIDGRHLLDKIVALKPNRYSDIEKILLPDKLKAITPYLKKGTVVYSYYTDGIIQETVRHIRNQGFKVATFTGDEDPLVRQKSLKDFIQGKIDVLVGSKPIGTSVDGLQKVASRLIPLTLPWTDSDYTQLKGRIYRQGSLFDAIDIIIPQVRIDLDDGEFWSWDIQRKNLIDRKRTLSDIAVDGGRASSMIPSHEILFKRGKESLEAWKKRVASGEIIDHIRERVQFDLYPEADDDEKRSRAQSELTEFNRLGKITRSTKMHEKFKNDPGSWHRYHRLRKENTESWDELPYEYIATKIKHTEDVVVDFGCGENLMRNCIPNNKVHAFDHIAIDDSVVACDMRKTDLEDCSVNIAVFSLSLWGSNWIDYIKEAHRVLGKRGCLYIAEPLSTYETEEDKMSLVSEIEGIGFQRLGELELRGKFLYLTFIKQ